MRETKFIAQNQEKWKDFERELEQPNKDPDKLSTLFVQVSDDLSYSRTFYPNRSVRIYLNKIAQRVFQKIYKNRTSKRKRFILFWKEELPQLIYQARYELLLSLAIFLLAVFIGILSSRYNPDFYRQILGDGYVKMTKENIKTGDPMAVYKQFGQGEMFLGITLNNIIVAFRTFVMGLFYAIGTVSMLIYNGIMIGCFHYFFYEHGLLVKSLLSVWLHGTLEISSIIIAGGAGLTLGKGLVFPGTYSRIQSLRISAQRGLKIMLGIIPILILAGFIESFITRYTAVPTFVKIALIFTSIAFIAIYFVWYPYMKSKKSVPDTIANVPSSAISDNKLQFEKVKDNGEIFKDVFLVYKAMFKTLFRVSVVAALVTSLVAAYFCADKLSYNFSLHGYSPKQLLLNARNFIADIRQYFDYTAFPVLAILNLAQFSITTCIVFFLFKKKAIGVSHVQNYRNFIRNSYIIFLVGLTITSMLFMDGATPIWLLLLLQPVFLMFMILAYYENGTAKFYTALTYTIGAFGRSYGIYFIILVMSILFMFILSSPYITWMIFDVITWNFILDESEYWKFFVGFFTFISFVSLHLCFALLLTGYQLLYFSLKEMTEANNLKNEILNMNRGTGLKP